MKDEPNNNNHKNKTLETKKRVITKATYTHKHKRWIMIYVKSHTRKKEDAWDYKSTCTNTRIYYNQSKIYQMRQRDRIREKSGPNRVEFDFKIHLLYFGIIKQHQQQQPYARQKCLNRSRPSQTCTFSNKQSKQPDENVLFFVLCHVNFSPCVLPSKVSHHFSSFVMRFLLSWDSLNLCVSPVSINVYVCISSPTCVGIALDYTIRSFAPSSFFKFVYMYMSWICVAESRIRDENRQQKTQRK